MKTQDRQTIAPERAPTVLLALERFVQPHPGFRQRDALISTCGRCASKLVELLKLFPRRPARWAARKVLLTSRLLPS